MRPARVHITGPSGSGTTTVGRLLALRLDYPHFDSDDFYWTPTSVPYRIKRERVERIRLMEELFAARPDWIVSGSLMGWGDGLIPRFNLVVYLYAPAEARINRLRDREAGHFGADATASGGWRNKETEEFLEWASHYEDGTREGRSQSEHEAWLAALPCPVLRLDATLPPDRLTHDVAVWLRDHEDERNPWRRDSD